MTEGGRSNGYASEVEGKTKLYRRGRRSGLLRNLPISGTRPTLIGGLDKNDDDELDEVKEYLEERNLPMTTEDRLRELAPYGITHLLPARSSAQKTAAASLVVGGWR